MPENPLPAHCWICGARADAPAVEHSVPGTCAGCERHIQPYDAAWQELSRYLRAHWQETIARGSFDLSKAFPRDAPGRALAVHLGFVRRLATRLRAGRIAVDLTGFAMALRGRVAHPEVVLLVADAGGSAGRLVLHDADVSVLRSGEEVQSALWVHVAHPIAIKVCWVKAGAPIREPDGFPWHPARQRKIVKISPYKGDTQPLVARRDLRI